MKSINLYGIKLGVLIDGDKGAINFGAIFDLASGNVGAGILNDFSLPYNEVVLPVVEDVEE